MPKIRRYFHCSQDLNGDPELWEMTHRLGDRSLRVWIELLSIGDRDDGCLPGMSEAFARQLSGRCQVTVKTVLKVWEHALNHLWIVSDPSPRLRNYGKFNRTRERNPHRNGSGDGSPPTPTPTPTPTPYKEDGRSQKPLLPTNGKWPDDSKWLLETLEECEFPRIYGDHLKNHDWWLDLSDSIGGLPPRDAMRAKFSAMMRWCRENPSKRPTYKGVQRFVAGWLQRDRERERKQRRET